eukprot:Seg2006.4 transcript_id=Seg2006.4/GoldUCD/mRNA.D3Y31 product="hypothetical protein" protein_id=Seg2006.4/GoldUCD/D3Y31
MCIQAVVPAIFEVSTAIKHSKLPAAWSNLLVLLEKITTNTIRRQPHQLSPPTNFQCQSLFAYFPNCNLTRRLYEPTEKILNETRSPPNHNIHAERVLAMADSQLRRAPNAKTDFISSKVRFKLNHSMDWLEREKDSGSIVAYAVGKGREAIKKRKVQDKIVEETKIKRMKERYQKMESKGRNQVQRKLKMIMSQSTFSKESIRDIHKDAKD